MPWEYLYVAEREWKVKYNKVTFFKKYMYEKKKKKYMYVHLISFLLPHSQQESEMRYLGAVSKMTEWSLFISKANHSIITVIQVFVPATNAEEAEVERF